MTFRSMLATPEPELRCQLRLNSSSRVSRFRQLCALQSLLDRLRNIQMELGRNICCVVFVCDTNEECIVSLKTKMKRSCPSSAIVGSSVCDTKTPLSISGSFHALHYIASESAETCFFAHGKRGMKKVGSIYHACSQALFWQTAFPLEGKDISTFLTESIASGGNEKSMSGRRSEII